MTTANKITLFRVILIPVFLILLYTGAKWAALAVYIVACISDTVDGYIARHYNQVTDFGKFMDPLADKILVLSAMCWFIEVGQMPGWLVAIVLFGEPDFGYGLRAVDPSHNRLLRRGVFLEKPGCVFRLNNKEDAEDDPPRLFISIHLLGLVLLRSAD